MCLLQCGCGTLLVGAVLYDTLDTYIQCTASTRGMMWNIFLSVKKWTKIVAKSESVTLRGRQKCDGKKELITVWNICIQACKTQLFRMSGIKRERSINNQDQYSMDILPQNFVHSFSRIDCISTGNFLNNLLIYMKIAGSEMITWLL